MNLRIVKTGLVVNVFINDSNIYSGKAERLYSSSLFLILPQRPLKENFTVEFDQVIFKKK